MQKIITLLFLTICIHTYTMESIVEHNLRLANLGVLLEEGICTVPLLCSGFSSLKDAAFSINALAQTNVMLNKSINDKDNALALIKQLSQQFDCPNIDVARVLCTQAANNRYALQRAFLVGWNYPSWNDIEKDVEKLHSIGLDLNFSYKQRLVNPLLQIVTWQEAGYSNMGLWLIKKGADVTCCTSNGRNALMIALVDYNVKLVDALIDHKACNVNHQDNDKTTLLHCCFYGLITHRIQGVQRDETRFSYIYNVIKKLLEKGANPTVINDDGDTPLDLAVKSEHRPFVQLLEGAIAVFNSKKSGNQVS